MFEQLESRQLMSASFNSAVGTVTVYGTDKDDIITFTKTATKLVVTENKVSVSTFDLAKVKLIDAYGKLGMDSITVDSTITIPAYLHGGGCQTNGLWTDEEWDYDYLKGGGGNDVLFADLSPTFMNGGAGNDTFIFQGNSKAVGGAGNDLFLRCPGAGSSGVIGGEGADTFSCKQFYSDLKIGNTADLEAAGIRESDLHELVNANTVLLDTVENFTGGWGNDTIIGSNQKNVIHGGAGNDQIFAKDGDDVIFAEAGNDLISAGNGHDTVYGGAGNDWIYANDGLKDYLHGDDGLDHAKIDVLDTGVTGVEVFMS